MNRDAINRPIEGNASRCDRQVVAEHLRLARRTSGDTALEAVAWARCMAPNSIPALRLEVRLLMEADHGDDADALIARGLLLRPEDSGLWILEARRQLQLGCGHRALETLEGLLIWRPHCREVRQLLARALLNTGRTSQAIDQLNNMAWAASSDARDALIMLVNIHLDADEFDAADRVISGLDHPPPDLVARIMRGHGRLLDAADFLQEAAERDREDPVLVELIRSIEGIGDVARLRTTLEAVDSGTPAALLQVSLAWLSLGDWQRAIIACDRLIESSGLRRDAQVVRVVALAMSGSVESARVVLSEWSFASSRTPATLLIEAWRRALLGRQTLSHVRTDPSRWAGSTSPLSNLLTSSMAALQSRADHDQEARAHFDIFQAALGQPTGPTLAGLRPESVPWRDTHSPFEPGQQSRAGGRVAA